jgi:predicted PurR-regulated permease PerM
MADGRKLSWVALGFALAAALSAWNPIAAPFGLLTGVAAFVIAARALRRGGRRRAAAAALALSVVAAVVSGFVLARTAGVGRELTGEPVVTGPSNEEAQRQLDEAAEQTRAARTRARDELGKIAGERAPPAQDAGKPGR